MPNLTGQKIEKKTLEKNVISKPINTHFYSISLHVRLAMFKEIRPGKRWRRNRWSSHFLWCTLSLIDAHKFSKLCYQINLLNTGHTLFWPTKKNCQCRISLTNFSRKCGESIRPLIHYKHTSNSRGNRGLRGDSQDVFLCIWMDTSNLNSPHLKFSLVNDIGLIKHEMPH